MNGDEKWFVCLLNLVELFTITVFVHTVGIADHHSRQRQTNTKAQHNIEN
jgi:hypothetical protein